MTTVFEPKHPPPVTLLPDGPKPDRVATEERIGSLFARLAVHRHERALVQFSPLTERVIDNSVHYTGPGIRFTREGATWSTSQNDLRTVAAMLRTVGTDGKAPIAIKVTGTPTFCRRAWFLGSAKGLVVTGYEPTAKDQQILTRLAERWQKAHDHIRTPLSVPQLEGSRPSLRLFKTHPTNPLAPGFDPSSLAQAGPPKPKPLPTVTRTPGRGR